MKRIIETLSTEENKIDLEKLITTLIGNTIDSQTVNKMIKGTNS